MSTKLKCGCTHNDTHWLHRCAACQAEDDIVSARWANDRANPPKVKVHRINGVVQGDIYKVVAERILQEATCQEPKLPEPPIGSNDISVQTVPMNGSDTTATPLSEPQIDYSALLSQF